MNDSVDMRRFGALNTAMKVTWITFGCGWLAILGVPPFSGFWSKDGIIETAFATNEGEGWKPWVFGLTAMIGAGITAFYMSRLFFMTFHGKKRWPEEAHPHESPKLMTWPMIILAIGSLGLGAYEAVGGRLADWLEPVTGTHPEEHPVMPVPVISVLILVLVAIGTLLAWRAYGAQTVPQVAPVGSLATRAARRDLFQDDVNEALLMRPGQYLTRFLVFFDNRGVDGLVGGIAASVGGLAGRVRRIQTGFVRSYALTMVAGVILVGFGVVAVRL
jgi:NADH-quinone oxidoreductase subunit L